MRAVKKSPLRCFVGGYLDIIPGAGGHRCAALGVRRSFCDLCKSDGFPDGFAAVSAVVGLVVKGCCPLYDSLLRLNTNDDTTDKSSLTNDILISFIGHKHSDRQTIGRSFVEIYQGSRTEYYEAIANVSYFWIFFHYSSASHA